MQHHTGLGRIVVAGLHMLRGRCLALLGLGLSGLAMAADPVLLPGSIQPGQLEKRFEAPPPARAEPIVVPEIKRLERPPKSAESLRFHLVSLALEGATIFSPETFRSLYADKLNHEISLLDVYRLAESITARYGNAGYLLSRAIVPPQTIKDGQVLIRIVEGYVDEVVIQGDSFQRQDLFRHYIDRIKANRALNASVLERYLLLANELPGMRLQSVLHPSRDNTAAATLVISVKRRPWSGGVAIDNMGSQTSGPWQSVFEGQAADLLGRFDQTVLRFATVPNRSSELIFYQLSHSHIFNGEGLRLKLDFSGSQSQPGSKILRQLEVETEGRALGLSLGYPLVRSRSRNLSLTAGLDQRSSNVFQLGANTGKDRLVTLRLGASYDQADTWNGVNQFSVTASQGLDVLDARIGSRANAITDYAKMEFLAQRKQALGARWEANVRLTGQFAKNSLPAPEQFGLGGENTVRGYEPSEWTGDRAMAVSLELAYNPSPTWDGTMQWYGYFDRGSIWRIQAANETGKHTIGSYGLGVRLSFPYELSLDIEAAKPLDMHADGRANSWRLNLRATKNF